VCIRRVSAYVCVTRYYGSNYLAGFLFLLLENISVHGVSNSQRVLMELFLCTDSSCLSFFFFFFIPCIIENQVHLEREKEYLCDCTHTNAFNQA